MKITGLSTSFLRELYGYMVNPLALIFMIIFLVMAASFTFYLGSFFERDQADMLSLFRFLPWLCVIFAPALAMRAWSEELRGGTAELLITLPISPLGLILGKFFALWLVGCAAILFTFPLWIAISYLGKPDHLMVISGYIGACLMMGGYLAITQTLSIYTNNQILALIPGVAISFIMTITGAPLFSSYLQGFSSSEILDHIAGLSFLVHYENFMRGTVNLRSVAYFVIFIAGCLMIAWLGLARVQHRFKSSKIGVNSRIAASIAGMMIMLIAVQALPFAQLDMTKAKLHTISQGVRAKLQQVNAPIMVEYYYSPALGTRAPQYGSYADRVGDMLTRFAALSNGQLRLKQINPQPFSTAEDDALAAGMQAIPDQSGDRFYFGIHAFSMTGDGNQGDGNQGGEKQGASIGFLQPERENFLEYDLIKLITSIDQNEKPSFGIITNAEMFGATADLMRGLPPKAWAVIDQAKEFYTVNQLDDPSSLLKSPPEVLAIIHPTQLKKDMIYAIDQYLLQGGKAAIFYDSFFETAVMNAQESGMDLVESGSNLPFLLDHWGIKVDKTHIVADQALAQMVQMTSGAQQAIPYAAWVGIDADHQQTELPLFANLETMMLPSAGHIDLENLNAALSATDLMWGSDQAYHIPVDRLETPDPLTLLEGAPRLDHIPRFASLISGTVSSAFGNKTPDFSEAEQTRSLPGTLESPPESESMNAIFKDHAHIESGEISAVLVADADMLADGFWVNRQSFLGQEILNPLNDNGAFFLNLIDQLQGDIGLAELRGRGVSKRPFEKIQTMRLQAEQQYRAREQQLSSELETMEQQLQTLRESELEQEIEQMVDQMLNIRAELRAVNLNLRQAVTALERRISYWVSFAVPALCLILALWIVYARRRKSHSF